MKAVPLLLVLITEVEEAGSVEQELHQVVRDQQHQAQSVEANTGEEERGMKTQNQQRPQHMKTTLNIIRYRY